MGRGRGKHMIVAINLSFWLMTLLTFFGMIGENKDAEIKRGCTNGFLICLTGLAIINSVYFL